MLETEITSLVILGGNQPQLGSKSCKVEIDGGGVWKRHADQMTTTGVGNGIEDEPVSMAVEPEWRHLLYGHAMQLRDVNYYSDVLISIDIYAQSHTKRALKGGGGGGKGGKVQN